MDVLLVGESWHQVSLFVKAQNITMSSSYTEAGEYLIAALETAGANVTYQPCHQAHSEFPRTVEEFGQYDCVLLSDIGAQSLWLTPEVAAGEADVNRLRVLSEYVAGGGAVGMVGGYMSFGGENGQAGYGRTPLADVLPVEIAAHDDRIERPAGVTPENDGIDELPAEWPQVLGYNRVAVSDTGTVWATVDDDPLVVVGDHGEGSAFAFTTDCAHHWAPTEFLEWERLPELWGAILQRVV